MTRGYRWPKTPTVTVARALLRVSAWWIPRSRRAAVIAEWEGELWALVTSAGAARARSSVTHVLAFCRGIVPYALSEARVARQDAARHWRRGPGLRAGIRPILWAVAQDVRHAGRLLVKRPGFSLTAIGIMGLGIGATTTIYSVVDRVLMRHLPYSEPGELVFFDHGSHTVPDLVDWRDRTEAFAMVAGSQVLNFDLTGDARPERVRAGLVTPNFYATFGAQPLMGRLLTADDFTTPAAAVVLSHRMWQQRWGADPAVLGRRLTINGHPMEVVGVMSPAFVSPELLVGRSVDVWLPFDLTAPQVQSRGRFILQVAARLRPGTTLEGAQAQLNTLAEALAEEYPDRYRRPDGSARPITISSLFDATVGQVSDTLFLLLGAVGLMLLIACANVANLLLARGTDRAREIALRTALGAGRSRVVAQLLSESIVLSLAGGAVGVVLAVLGVAAFGRLNPGGIPRIADLAIDLRILAFALLASVLTGVLFGAFPAVQATRSDVNEVLKEGAGGVTESRGGRRIRDGLVVAEMAMALVLLAGAGALFDSFLRLQQTDPGIETEHVVDIPLALSSLSDEERGQFTEQVLERLARLPGTQAVGAGITAPFQLWGGSRCCWFMDFSKPAEQEVESAIVHPVTPGYFPALGATTVRGRGFSARDEFDEAAPPIPVILNATMARRLFGDEDPVGQALDMEETPMTVVGVVNDIRHWGLADAVDNDVYVPAKGASKYFFRLEILLRTTTATPVLAEQVRDVIWSVDPDLPVTGLIAMEDRVARSIARPRFYSLLIAVFAILALLLAAGGMYSSMLYSVGRRYRELGIRLALGARAGHVTRLIVSHGVALTATGIVFGLLGAFLLTRVLQRIVFGAVDTHHTMFAAAAAFLAVVAIGACYLPARKAANADPIEALRTE